MDVSLVEITAAANKSFSEWAKARVNYEKSRTLRNYQKAKAEDTNEMTPEELEEYLVLLATVKS